MGTSTVDTCGSGINVDDYEISDMKPTGAVQPSPLEVGSSSRARGKGRGKVPIVGTKKNSLEKTSVVAMYIVDVPEDPIISTGQRVRQFWERITKVYKNKPSWAWERDFDRIQSDITKYADIVKNVHKLWPSGARAYDIHRNARQMFFN